MSAQDRHLAEVERLKFSAYHCSVVVHTVTLLTSAKAISLESMKDSRLMVSLSVSIVESKVVVQIHYCDGACTVF